MNNFTGTFDRIARHPRTFERSTPNKTCSFLNDQDFARLHTDWGEFWHTGKIEGALAEVNKHMRGHAFKGCPPGTEFPPEALVIPLWLPTRALNVTTGTAGGFTVGQDVLSIETALRPVSRVVELGARVWTGLRADSPFALETSSLTFSWPHELAEVTPTDPVFGAMNLTPHRLAASTQKSMQLEVQSPLHGKFLDETIMAGIGDAIDRAAIVGSGIGGEPSGIYSTSGVNEVAFSGSAATWAKALAYVQPIATANGDDAAISFLAHPAVRTRWKQIQRFTGSDGTLWHCDEDTVAGKPAAVSTNVPATGIVAGDFSKMVIGFFGADAPMSITVDRISSAKNGLVNVTINIFADIGLIRPGNFSRNSDSAVV